MFSCFKSHKTKKPSSLMLGSGGLKYKTQQAKENSFFVNFNESNAWPLRYSLDAVIMGLFFVFV